MNVKAIGTKTVKVDLKSIYCLSKLKETEQILKKYNIKNYKTRIAS